MNLSSLGLSALFNAQQNLQITGHNINNAAVEGYSRQSVISQTAGARGTGAGFIGRGVEVVTVRRSYDAFLSKQLVQSQSKGAGLIAYGNEISQVNNLFADRTVGINPAMQEFFEALNAVGSNPADPAARQELLGRSQSLVTQFNDTNRFLDEQRENINTQVRTAVTQANSYLERINDLNQQITKARASSPGHAPNDLLDQRDQLVSELNQIVEVQAHEQDGVVSLTIGNGQTVLGGTKVFPLEAQRSNTDPSRIVVAYTSAYQNGEAITAQLPDNAIRGGELGGLLKYRSESLDSLQNTLGRLAVSMAAEFNHVHEQGVDLAGNPGGKFFGFELTQPIPTNPKTGTSPQSGLSVSLAKNADGSPQVGNLTANDYQLSFKGNGQFELKTLPNGSTATVTAQQLEDGYTINGVELKMENAGNSVDGDTWTIQPMRQAAADIKLELKDPAKFAAALPGTGSANGENALNMASLQTTKTMANGSMNFNDAFSQLVNQVAVQAQENGTAAKAQSNLIQQNFAAQQQVSGVNLDEEYLQLDRYVEQYRAASRLIDVSSTLFDTLLGLRS